MNIPGRRLQILFDKEKDTSAERLIMLSDGIFAIAITLLVLDIKIPESTPNFPLELGGFFSKTLYYIITFLVIAQYWGFHRRTMHMITHVDTRFIQLNLLFLAIVAFFPAAMNLQISNGRHPETVTIYILVLAACGFSGHAMWLYATWKHRLIDQEIDRKFIIQRSINALMFPTFICLSLLLFLIPYFQHSPELVYASWVLLPLAGLITRAVGQRILGKDDPPLTDESKPEEPEQDKQASSVPQQVSQQEVTTEPTADQAVGQDHH